MARRALDMPVTVIPNGVPGQPEALAGAGAKAEARRTLGLAPGAGMVLFAAHGGERAAYKAGDSWRGIWAAIKARVPRAVGFAVGGDEAGRDGDLLLWPYVEPERMRLLLAAADVFVYPTRADNHPLLLLEAMAAGAPVAASGVGGIPEQVRHGSTGLLADPGDDRALADAAASLLEAPARARDLGNAARAAWAERFTVRRMGTDHLRLYRSMTADA
jgi:glycosyltransferase involved in cell wall biosynthesis